MDFLEERGCGGEEVVAPANSQKPAVPAPFLTKTYDIVDDRRTDHIVSWGVDGGGTFVVWRPPEFAKEVLPKYFKHSNFSSFVRQLNTYGFRKIVAERWEFANEFFKKGEKQLLSDIHRRKNNHIHSPHHQQHSPPFTEVIVGCPWPPLSSVAVADFHETDFLSALSDDNRRLRRRNALLLSEIARMKELYHDVVHFLRQPTAPALAQGRVTIREEEEDDDHDCSTVKLFGVPLQSN